MLVKSFNLKRLLISLAIPLLAGGAATLLSPDSSEIYATLNKPFMAPPGYVFPIVWTVLYILMGLAAYIVTSQKSETVRDALKIYYLSLGLNALWPVIFFTFGLYWAAAAELFLLWLSCLLVFWCCFNIDRTAAWLFLPTVLWVSFAAYLNVSFAMLN